MKKLFALLSTFVLTLAIVGLSVKSPAQAAGSDKWTVDPTLAEDEIPMYEMGSIYTTFPNFYDNAAKADELWGGSSRMYPWNETRLRVAQYDETGAATGKYYAIYFSGLTSATNSDGTPASGAGNNINGYAYKETKDADGNVTAKTLTTVRVISNTYGTTKEKFNYNATPADPSLSHLRINFTGEDISFDGIALAAQIGDAGNAQNFYNRMFVVDGQGRIIRGTAMDGFYLKAGTDGAPADVWAPEFCYVDGVVTKYVEGETVCDKYREQLKDEEGDLSFDKEGNPILSDTEEDNFLYKRFTWAWYAEKPTNVNTVSWKAEGWDCDLWDLVIDAPEGEGFIAIAFINGEGTNHKINDEEREVTNATREKASKAALPTGDYYRECVRQIVVPAGGATFDFGYLDKGVATEAAKFNNIIRGAFYSGRTENTTEFKTYNFSQSGLKINSLVDNEYSYQLMDRKENYIEVQKGVTFKPARVVDYQGIASVWKQDGNFLSYSKDLDALEYSMYVSVNNKEAEGDMVVYKYPYADKAEMIADFEKDVKAWFAPGTSAGGTDGKFQDFTVAQTSTVGWDFISTSFNAKCFWASAENRTKWVWMINYVSSVRKANGLSTTAWDTIDQGFTSSPGTFNAEVQAFLNDTQLNPGAWNRTSDYTIEENANGFLPTQTNQQSFVNYTIDTTDDEVGTVYTVKFVVANKTAGSKESMVIHYVVEDTYTPILNINKANLFITPQEVDGKFVINPIDPMTLVSAYTGKYNGKNILGNDITHNVVFESETLDFDLPTEGTHRVVATISVDAKHVTKKSFDVVIEDVSAPYVDFYSSLTLEYGATWNPADLVKTAVDNVDGNLKNASFEWCVDVSSSTVKTNRPGTYNVKVAVYDLTGNSVESQTIKVTVLPQGLTADDLKDLEDALGSLGSKVDGIVLGQDELAEAVEALPNVEAINGIKAAVDTINGNTTPSEGGCGSNTYFIQLLTAGSLLVFLLRKKH